VGSLQRHFSAVAVRVRHVGAHRRRAQRQAAHPSGGRDNDAFADDFVRGMKRMTEGLEVYKHMLRAFTASETAELLDGIDSRELLRRITEEAPAAKIRQSDLTQRWIGWIGSR
jgi:hypothetical protein